MWTYLAGLPIALLFGASGFGHFAAPAKFITMMQGLPMANLHPAAVTITGAMEIAGAAMVVASPSAAVFDALFMFVLLVTPANINMWYNDLPFDGQKWSQAGHLARGVMQVVLLAWIATLGNKYRHRGVKIA